MLEAWFALVREVSRVSELAGYLLFTATFVVPAAALAVIAGRFFRR